MTNRAAYIAAVQQLIDAAQNHPVINNYSAATSTALEIESLLSLVGAGISVKIIGMPHKGGVTYGVYIDDDHLGISVHAENVSWAIAAKKARQEYRDNIFSRKA